MKQLFTLVKHRLPYHIRLILSIVVLVVATQLIGLPALATGVYEIPSLAAGDPTWVIDKDEIISRINEGSISTKLDKLAKETGFEVRFVTVRRFDYGETAETFADKLFDKWFPTGEAKANQVLLVLDTTKNTSAIRTGDDLKSILSDEIAESVAQETLMVPLREGDKYNQAFLDAADRLVAVLSGEADPGARVVADTLNVERTFKKAEETDQGNSTIVVVVLLIAATVIPMVTYFWYQGFS
ncbi:TPM domain-containing protein [Ancylothrix sp. C2]|uniref:photosystem II repair protein Psb32 n=1 Tax=Ancylothrix sp. D3o TaxID=2953691 RepID=UPI0021BA4B6E|nr:TPM domain-containing protein [Ancylothrix sp. D3o]MCT7949503.1 TPM domain-containing protein [Ancylothrix sp. D3o]